MTDKDPPPSPRPTLEDLACALGVSRTTVSNAFNRPDQLSAELRERVLAAAQEMGYPGPNPAARMLRTGRAGAIGAVFNETLRYAFGDPTAIAFLQGVATVCEEARLGLLILPAVKSAADQDAALVAAVDGFIIYSLPRDSEAVTRVLGRRLPMVVVDEPCLDGVPLVGIDDGRAARLAAAHLAALGHRHFGVVAFELRPDGYAGPVDAARRAGITYEISAARLAGYDEALAAAGLDPLAVPVEEQPGNLESMGCQAARALLTRSPRPTAILALSDRLALGAVAAAHQLGLEVPRDLSIVGFDDIPAASAARPPLTTIRQPLVEKGATAARLLLAPDDERRDLILPAQLIVRGSTAPPPTPVVRAIQFSP